MLIKTILKEEKPTVTGRIYQKGSLRKIKDIIDNKIKEKIFFVFPPLYNSTIYGTSLQQVIGFVNSFVIKDDTGYFDITILKYIPIFEVCENLYADFLLGNLDENNYVNLKDLKDIKIYGMKLYLKDKRKEKV